MGFKIDAAYTSGLAYFSNDKERFVRTLDGAIHSATKSNNYPNLIQYGNLNPLLEPNREFDTKEDAADYVDAINSVNRMINYALASEDPASSTTTEIKSKDLFAEEQKIIKEKYLPLLKTHKKHAQLEELVNSTPEKIVEILSGE